MELKLIETFQSHPSFNILIKQTKKVINILFLVSDTIVIYQMLQETKPQR